jgi:hypothetical protein
MEKPPILSRVEDVPVSERRKGLLEKLGQAARRNKTVIAIVLASEMALGTSLWLQEAKKSLPTENTVSFLEFQEGHPVTQSEQKMAEKLEREVGLETLERIEELDSIKTDADRAKYIMESDTGHLRVSGFNVLAEKYDGPSNEEMETVIRSLPKMYQIHAPAVRYEDKEEKLPERYGLSGKGGKEAAHADPLKNEIVFSAGIRNEYFFTLSTILHEEAHFKDWETNRAMTLDERMKLAQEVIDRVNARDRFLSSYVESIRNPDKQTELGTKAGEYYAEITEAYFMPNSGSLLSQKDRKIVEEVLHQTDSTYKKHDRKKSEDVMVQLLISRARAHGAETHTMEASNIK